MDIINHAVTLISIIVGIGLTEMFGNLHRLIRNRAQVSWDWLPVLWAASLLVLVINYWWAIYQGIIGLDRLSNAAELGLILIQPILLFLLAASVLPSFGAGRTCDMRLYYEDSRRTFLVTFVVYQILNYAIAFIIGTLGWNIATGIRTIILLLLVVALLINKRWFDWLAAAGTLGVLILRLTTQLTR